MKKNKKITEDNLQKISDWLRNSTLSDFEKNTVQKNETEKFIEDMVVVDPNQIKEPYTL